MQKALHFLPEWVRHPYRCAKEWMDFQILIFLIYQRHLLIPDKKFLSSPTVVLYRRLSEAAAYPILVFDEDDAATKIIVFEAHMLFVNRCLSFKIAPFYRYLIMSFSTCDILTILYGIRNML